jgi:hypothetical protein
MSVHTDRMLTKDEDAAVTGIGLRRYKPPAITVSRDRLRTVLAMAGSYPGSPPEDDSPAPRAHWPQEQRDACEALVREMAR